jgi:hypothetical protein
MDMIVVGRSHWRFHFWRLGDGKTDFLSCKPPIKVFSQIQKHFCELDLDEKLFDKGLFCFINLKTKKSIPTSSSFFWKVVHFFEVALRFNLSIPLIVNALGNADLQPVQFFAHANLKQFEKLFFKTSFVWLQNCNRVCCVNSKICINPVYYNLFEITVFVY